jgi:hypothetical protein
MNRRGILLCLFTVCLLALVFPSQAAAANPILIVTSSSNPYTTFLPEIIRTEGFNEFDTADISVVTSATLSAYDLVILGDMSLTAAQVTTLTTWVNGGGNLIAMHPDPQLAGLLGLVDTGTALSNAYVLMSTSAGPGVGLVGQTIQFHGPAELYTLNGATSYATLYSSVSTPTSNPGLVLKQAGSGQAAAFTYDLARSVAYTRQGNPAWTGQARDSVNAPPIRSYNLFYGAASFDPEPDWVNLNNVQIPQADEQQRLLANLILQMNTTKKPLPRFWYLPKGLKAAVVMTGDDHGSFYSGSATANRFSDFIAASPSGCSVANWECVRGTAYLFPKIIATNTLTNTQIASYISQGFEIGVHVDSATTCNDWTTSALDAQYTSFLASLASQYPSVPAPQTHRMHCVSWSDYDSQPAIELKHGIRFDTTYYYWPATWINDLPGMYTGSGMPMRYTDRNGNLINVYQATTQMTDESGQTFPLNINTLLDNALSGSGYYGVFTANMHNDGGDYPGPGAAFIVASAQARGVPVVTSLQMLQWLDGRNGSSFGSLAWSGNVLSFSITVGANANNLRAMLPANAGTLGLSSLLLNGSPVSYQLQTTKGILYAMFTASAGNYQATYGGSPIYSISGAVSPAAVAAGTTVTATGPVTVTATPDSYGNYSLSGLPSGSYIVTPSEGSALFSPASQSVTISGANVAAVNFAMVQTCPCSLWTNSSVPGTVASGDASAIEVGVRFHADVAGKITGIRFYKSSLNTGTHVGNLWSNTGTKLGTATFSSETASGWQQVNFATPVAIIANTVYVASYHTTTGNYSDDAGYFASSYDFPPLHGAQDGTSGANGVYRYGNSAFPNSTYESDNYWVDVVFSPTGIYSISGTISGTGGNGATVTLSGAASATATASSSGTYTFSNLANGSYAVTPSKAGFTFGPTSQNVTINGASVSAVNFTSAAIPTYSVSGTISGAGGSGATVTLSGTAGSTAVTANTSGAYTFTGVVAGSYTVTPSGTGYLFSPTSQPVTVTTLSVTGVNFSTTAQTYTLQGTISGAGGIGATVNLSGTSAGVATADGSGNYTFTGLVNGPYVVAPSQTGFTFTPATQPATVSNANVTSVNFSSAQNCPCSLWSSTTVPGTVNAADPSQVELGVRFTSDVAGSISGIRFYKGSADIGPHIGNLWTNTGTLLNTATFSNETASGWQQVNFASPVAIAANTTYVASYNTASGNYAYDQNYFAVAYNNAPLHGAQDGGAAGSNGVFLYGASAFPTGTYLSTNYYVDVVLTTATTAATLSSVTLNPSSVAGGTSSTGTVTLSSAAPTGGAVVALSSNNAAATVPASVTVAASATTATFTVTTVAVGSPASATITGTYSGGTQTGTLTVNPPVVSSVTVNPTAVTGGTSSTGTVTLGSAAPTGGLSVTLSSNNAAVTVPASVTVAAGATTATFTVTTTAVASTASATISATFNGGTQTATLTVNPPGVSSVTLNPTSVTGGTSSTGTVTLSSAAPTGGAVVTLSSNNAAATVPASVTVAANATTATFTVTTIAVGSPASATISGTYTGATQTATLTVNPPVVSSVGLNPTSVTGGSPSTGTVTLGSAAPTGGLSVGLSSNSTSATVPASVTVAAGATTATFSVTTTTVTSTTTATISATFNGGTQTAALTINPSSGATFSISGTISNAGGNAATVTLSGAASATVTASATGTYTFSNLANGSYTVTPSKSGYIFTPANTAVTVNGANMTANFTSTAQLVIDKTASTDRSTASTSLVSPAFTTTSTNELLLAFVSSDAKSAGITVSAMTGGSLTWTMVKRTNTQLGTSEVWRAFAPAILTNATVTATLSQSVSASITVVTFKGVDTTGTGGSGAIGATGTGNSAKGAPTASLTTTRNNSWVIGVGNDYDTATSRTVPATQTMVHQYLATTGDTFWVQRQTNTTPTSGTVVTINDTAPTTDRYNLTTVEVLPAQ